jgi:adhesin transport system outer membrane protein
MNDRLHTGLTLFITAAEAREKSEMAERGLGRMREFNRVVTVRVTGGLSSLADQRVVRAKISDMEQQAATHREAERASLSELASMMGGQSVARLQKAHAISAPQSHLIPLDVLRAQAEAKRSLAETDAAKAGLFPGLTASGLIGKGGSGSLDLGGNATLGAGTRAELEALSAQQRAAQSRVTLAKETASRAAARTGNELTAFIRQERDAADLVQQTRANFRLFQDQFEGGQKSVMDVVNVYEQMILSELKHIDLKYKTSLTQLEIARMYGALARGTDI